MDHVIHPIEFSEETHRTRTGSAEDPQATLSDMLGEGGYEETEMAALAARFVNSTNRHVFLTG